MFFEIDPPYLEDAKYTLRWKPQDSGFSSPTSIFSQEFIPFLLYCFGFCEEDV